ncbi:MAG TPA: glycerophosphodiester phosphodiesterase [Burkholderiaceae bacterium]|nr:glycerophosphodiester phosphodiesterase [Burkholderiaceae bacterium]
MTDWPYPYWIAHRGAGKLAPENTLAAFRLGAQHGYGAFECDVKLSADDVPFLLHDATLTRTAGVEGVAGERPWSELSRLDAGGWHSRLYAGEPMATLEGVAGYVLRNRFHLNIEIKPTPGHEERTGRVVARHAARLWRDAAHPPLLSSFQPLALAAAQASEPALPRALLLDELHDGWFEQAAQLGCVAVVANQSLWTGAMVERLHAEDLRALAYTVNEEAMARHLTALGLDGLITDAVDRFPAQAGRRF